MLASEVEIKHVEKLPSNVDIIDQALTGGYVEGYSILLSGTAGAGKSTMLSQALASFGDGIHISSEEGSSDMAGRLQRLSLPLDRVTVYPESIGESVIAVLNRGSYKMAAIDSIQGFSYKGFGLNSMQAGIEFCKDIHRWAHSRKTIVWIVCQENKQGLAAGAQALAHIVDAIVSVEYSEDHPEIRHVRTYKNRRGRAPQQVDAILDGECGLVPAPPRKRR